MRVISGNHAFYAMSRTTPKQLTGGLLREIASGQWASTKLYNLLKRSLKSGGGFRGFRLQQQLPKGKRRTLLINGTALESGSSGPKMILLTMDKVA